MFRMLEESLIKKILMKCNTRKEFLCEKLPLNSMDIPCNPGKSVGHAKKCSESRLELQLKHGNVYG